MDARTKIRNATYDIAMAAGRDAGNRSAKENGRGTWNEDDWNAARQTANALFDPIKALLLSEHELRYT